MKLFGCLLTAASLSVGVAAAEPRSTFSFAHLFSNDFIGDGQDRWHTGAYVFSILKELSHSLDVELNGANAVLEFRFRSEIIAPSNLVHPTSYDRPYAGILSLGVHRYSQLNNIETALGVDLVMVGNQTGMLRFQSDFHRLFGAGDFGTLPQISNAIYPTMLGELAKSIELSEAASVRPFVEAQAGVETFVRGGVDFELGRTCLGQFKIRDVATGQRYPAFACKDSPSIIASMGLDVARVFDSHYLPTTMGPGFSSTRSRIRLGLHHTGRLGSIFYGLTWLGEEFHGQPGRQLVGSVSVSLRF